MKNKVCTFFGHRDCPDSVKPQLRKMLVELIETQEVDTFYVGSQGKFDSLVLSVLEQLSQKYPHISYEVVLAYFPVRRKESLLPDFSHTLLPEGIEKVPPRAAISWRNQWMLRQADVVVTYVNHNWGGAAQFAALARKQGKMVRPLGKI